MTNTIIQRRTELLVESRGTQLVLLVDDDAGLSTRDASSRLFVRRFREVLDAIEAEESGPFSRSSYLERAADLG